MCGKSGSLVSCLFLSLKKSILDQKANAQHLFPIGNAEKSNYKKFHIVNPKICLFSFRERSGTSLLTISCA